MEKLIANQNAYETLAAYVHGGRLSHALLIEGPAGCGKTAFAQFIAQAAMCEAAPSNRPCGSCRHCKKIDKHLHPDFLVYGGSGAQRSFHIDTVRTLRAEAFIRAGEARCKVMLLRNAHEMSAQAQNALLKLMEEPPSGVYFVLTCENRSLMLETIRSRVQCIALELPTVEACAAYLTQALPQLDFAAIQMLSQRTGGNIGAALALVSDEQTAGDPAAQTILYDLCLGDELHALQKLMAYERKKSALSALLIHMTGVLHEILLHPHPEHPLQPLQRRAGDLRLMQMIAIIEDTEQAVHQNVNNTLLVTSLCARIRALLSEG